MTPTQYDNGSLDWLSRPPSQPDAEIRSAAVTHQALLTKPPGALGRLEEIAIQLTALQKSEQPVVDRVEIVVFAGDHGIAGEGVSAFPQAVTAEMVKNFANGGAAISVAARTLGAKLEVINLGTVGNSGLAEGVQQCPLGPGTTNFIAAPAMTEQQLAAAPNCGRHAVEQSRLRACQLFIGGEMGIGNTTAASALACALLDAPPEQLTGPGTGLDRAGVVHKSAVIQQALTYHRHHLDQPLEVLRRLGGFEIAALAGSYITCAQVGLPVLVDGFISTVAALVATRLNTGVEEWLLFSHASAEPGHRRVIEALEAKPLLDLGLRLGEGSGAAVAVPLLRMACALHNEMATFASAGISSGKNG